MSIGDIQLSKAAMPDAQRSADNSSRGDYQPDKSDKTPEELKDEPLAREQVESFLWEIQQQPNWRREADKCCDYYDNNQLSPETIETLKDRGQPPLISNLVKPTIDTVLGMEVKSRTDWRVRPEDDDVAGNDLSEALSIKLKHCETESRADRACSDAYAAQLKAGLGWVEVNRESDPFKYRYRAKSIHRREIFWDWRAEAFDLSDARYQIRRRWVNLDQAIAMMPEYANLFKETVSAWAGFDPLNDQRTGLAQGWEIERDTKMDRSDWRDMDRKRVCLFEIWYRKWVRGYVLTSPDGEVVEADFNNPRHCEAIVTGKVKISMATFQKVRLAWYCGPHFLYDIPSPHKHGYFPYVPFFGYREDQTQAPYGLVRTMISPQDEINARKSKMLWSLNSRRVITDADAVTDHAKTMAEVARADAYIILAKNRNPNSKFEVEPGGELATQQFEAMQEAKQEIAETSGIHKAMMGQNSNASSGLAINSLLEQGLNTLAEINDNFRFARRMVGEMLFSMMQQDLSDRPIKVPLGEGKSRKVIILNEPVIDEQGQQVIKNDVSKVRAKVVLDDVPSTPTFRMQQLQMLTEITKSLPPEIQGQIIDFVIAATDMKDKEQIVDRLRRTMNIPDDSPEAEAAAKQQADQQAQVQQKMIELDIREKEAKIGKLEADAEKVRAEAGQGPEGAMQPDPAVEALQQQVQQLEQQLFMKDVDTANKLAAANNKADVEIEKAHIAASGQVEIAKINLPANQEIEKLNAKIVELKASIQDVGKEAKAEAKEPAKEKATEAKPAPKAEGKKPVKRNIIFKHDAEGRVIGAEVS